MVKGVSHVLPPVSPGACDVLVVMTTMPSEDEARTMSRVVLEARVAACVNQMAPCRSEYWWDGKLEQAQEWPLLIKTTRACYPELVRVILAHHPYSVPEVVALSVVDGHPPYLQWVSEMCQTSSEKEVG